MGVQKFCSEVQTRQRGFHQEWLETVPLAGVGSAAVVGCLGFGIGIWHRHCRRPWPIKWGLKQSTRQGQRVLSLFRIMLVHVYWKFGLLVFSWDSSRPRLSPTCTCNLLPQTTGGSEHYCWELADPWNRKYDDGRQFCVIERRCLCSECFAVVIVRRRHSVVLSIDRAPWARFRLDTSRNILPTICPRSAITNLRPTSKLKWYTFNLFQYK